MLITLREASERLGIHISTIRAWAREGRIPTLRVGRRFARVDWDALLKALGTSPTCDSTASEKPRT
jgi:excisionase family DNA binding protein